ncbi:MAG: large-conductance mechanosensitive channel protein MscL [Alphaproteobacteria bacterium]
MSIIQEFKAFAMRGNVIDLAVGVVIGGAFGKIVSSIVENIIMPIIGVLTSGVDFKDLGLILKAADPVAGTAAVSLGYGAFIQSIFDFTIIAFAIFMMIKMLNKASPKKDKAPEVAAVTDIQLLAEIRDLLKKQAKAK